MKDPLLGPLIAFVVGILLSRWLRFYERELWIALPLLFALTLLAMRRSRWIAIGSWLVTLCFAGIYIDTLHRPRAAPSIDSTSQETVLLSGCVVDPPVFYEGRDQFTVELARKASARVSLTIRDGESPPDLRYGQRVELEAKVRPIRNYQNPSGFDVASYSARREIYWNASMRAGAAVTVLPGDCGSRFLSWVFALRIRALKRIETLYPNNPYAIGMMEAVLLGETSKLEKLWTEHFRRTGTFHALVISGMHISVLAGTLLFLMRLLFIPELPALAATASAAWLYAMVSGWSAPVVRAAGGFTLYLTGRYFYRERRLMNLISAVALGYLVYDPGQLFESSFQLSFLSVVAIAAIATPLLDATSAPYVKALAHIKEVSRDPRMEPRAANFRVEIRLLAETLFYAIRLPMPWGERLVAFGSGLGIYIYDMVAISTVVQIGLALPMAIYFHRVSFTGLSANVIIVPLLSLVIPVGFLAVFTGWHWPAAIAEALLRLAEIVANWHVQWEPDTRIPNPPLWLAVMFSLALLILTYALHRSWKWGLPAVSAVLCLFGLIVWHPFSPQVSAGTLEMTAVDVGQGDGLLVVFPDGKMMMVDGGGFPNIGNRKIKPKLDIGEDVISPYLWSRSIRKLDVLVSTHSHEDHTGGIGALVDNFKPSLIWTGANGDNEVWRSIASKAKDKQIPVEPLHCCQSFNFGGARIDILAPLADYQPLDIAKNNDSLVMRISYGQRSFLLTGDMEKQVEYALYAEGRLSHSDVLKIPHHGSKTSTTQALLDAVRPTFAVISDGYENTFHHPHPDVVARLAEARVAVLRTDQLGLITIRTDGYRITVDHPVDPKAPAVLY